MSEGRTDVEAGTAEDVGDKVSGLTAKNKSLLALLVDARPYVEAGLYLSEHGSKSQYDIFRATETLQRIDKVLSGA